MGGARQVSLGYRLHLGHQARSAAFHLDNAKKKLGVRTKNQAVALLASSRRSIL